MVHFLAFVPPVSLLAFIVVHGFVVIVTATIVRGVHLKQISTRLKMSETTSDRQWI